MTCRILTHRIRIYLIFYPGTEILSYPCYLITQDVTRVVWVVHWLYWNSCASGHQVTSLLCYVASPYNVTSQHMKGLLGAFFKAKIGVFYGEQDSCEVGIEKSIPLNH